MSLFGDDDPPPTPHIPPPPPPQEMLDVIDEVTGTQTITVTGSDGKKRRMIQKLPRSQEEEALYQEAGQLMERAIGEMKRLYDYDPSQLVHYAPFVDTLNALNQERSEDMAELTKFSDFNGYVQDFKDMQKSVIDEEYKRESNRLEESLAHKGLSDSTTGFEERNLLNRHAITARQRAGVEAQMMGEQLKGADLANRANAFNLREATRQGRLSAAATEYDLQKDYAGQLGEQRDKALTHQSHLYSVAAGIRGADTNKAMATMAPNMALAEFSAKNNNALNYYNADVNRITQQYGMELGAHKAQGPGFGQSLLHLGGNGGHGHDDGTFQFRSGRMGNKTLWRKIMAHSLPNSLDYQKHGLNLHKNQIDLTKNRVELMEKKPGAFGAEIGLLDDFQSANQTRKPGWRALLDGLTSGLKYSLKSAEGEKKRATYANMEKMLSSFEEVSRQLQQQNEKNTLRQENMETKVIPSAVGYLTYLQNNPTYDEAFNNLNSRVEQIKTVMDFDGDLVALSPRNYEVGIFKDRKTGQLKETPISSLLPPDLLKGRPDLNTYERAKDAERMGLERQKADARTIKAQNAGQSSDAQKQARLAADEEETKTYLELYGLLKDPNIDPTSSTGTGIKNWAAQNVPLVGGLVGEGLSNQQAYSQATANLKGQAFKKHGYRNQAEFENIHTLPDTLPRKEALKFVEAELRKKGIRLLDASVPGSGGTTQQIKVQDPSTGQIGFLSPEQAKIAISRGGIQVE